MSSPDTIPALELSSGLSIAAMWEATPPAMRVTGIGWFSGFRNTGLQVGDQILAVDGDALPAKATPAQAQQALGTYGEAQRWAQARKAEGAPLKLTVRRRATTTGQGWQMLEITGRLLPAVNTRTADNRILIGSGGPPEMYEKDGFDSSWRQWADEFAKISSAVLDDPLHALALTSTFELKKLQAQQPRVALLVQKYPGPFADAVQQDFTAMLARLQGADITLPVHAMDYRSLGEHRAAEIRVQAQAAWTALQAELAAQTITPLFPAVHLVHGDRASVIGRYAMLPPLRNRDWVGEAGRTWFVAGSASNGWYFADAEGPEAVRMMDALSRYRRLVMPNPDESYQLIGQVLEQPAQLVMGERAYFGLQLRPVAALIGGAVFVDLRQAAGHGNGDSNARGVAPFAGEEALRDEGAEAPPDTASPTEVMQAMVAALKVADLPLWTSLFATWGIESLPDGRALFRMNAVEQPARYFEEARRRIMERVHDMRPVWVDEVRAVIPGDDYPGQLRLEEVIVEMQHIGRFEGEAGPAYRPFSDVTVNRWWRLQRLGPPGALGPWRITSLQPI